MLFRSAFKAGRIENAHVYGDDFGSPDETYIANQFTTPVMIHRYPAAVKAFYMQPDPQDPSKALCVDVLAPEQRLEMPPALLPHAPPRFLFLKRGARTEPALRAPHRGYALWTRADQQRA